MSHVTRVRWTNSWMSLTISPMNVCTYLFHECLSLSIVLTNVSLYLCDGYLFLPVWRVSRMTRNRWNAYVSVHLSHECFSLHLTHEWLSLSLSHECLSLSHSWKSLSLSSIRWIVTHASILAVWKVQVDRHPVGRHPVGRHPVDRHAVGRHAVGMDLEVVLLVSCS